MNTKPYPTPLEGLTDAQKSELEGVSTLALEIEAGRLGLAAKRLQLDAFGVGEKTAVDEAAKRLAGEEAALDTLLKDAPHLAKPVAGILELAQRARENDSTAAGLLGAVRTELKAVASHADEVHAAEQRERIADERRESAKRETPTAARNELEGESPVAPRDPTAVPEDVAKRYIVRGKEFVNPRGEKVAFVDLGSRLQTDKSFDGYAVKSMVAIAEARGWESITVSGDEAFRRAVWMEAASRGLAVKGYTPSEAEHRAALSAAERNGRLNRIEANPASKAFIDAKDGADRVTLAKQHPELKQAFALETALRRFAEQRLQPKDREAFVEHQRRNIANDLAQGKPLPDVGLRVQRQQTRDRQVENER